MNRFKEAACRFPQSHPFPVVRHECLVFFFFLLGVLSSLLLGAQFVILLLFFVLILGVFLSPSEASPLHGPVCLRMPRSSAVSGSPVALIDSSTMNPALSTMSHLSWVRPLTISSKNLVINCCCAEGRSYGGIACCCSQPRFASTRWPKTFWRLSGEDRPMLHVLAHPLYTLKYLQST
jgi:hypothetical protein